MNDTLPTLPAPTVPRVIIVLQGIGAATTDKASRLGYPSAAVVPCEDERVDFGQLEPVNENWSEVKNQRRCELINRKYADGLTPRETRELAELQTQMLRYRDRVAPLPIEHARRLYNELLAGISATHSPTES